MTNNNLAIKKTNSIFIKRLLLVSSFVLYMIAPNEVSYPVIYASFLIFLICCWLLLKKDFKEKNYFTFNTIFLVSFFLTTYSFPVFILGAGTLLDDFINLSVGSIKFVDFDYVSKTSSLCTLAISLYLNSYNERTKNDFNTQKQYQGLSIVAADALLIIGTIATLLNIIITVRSFSDRPDFNDNPFIYDIFPVVYSISLVARKKKDNLNTNTLNFLSQYRLPLICSSIIVLIFFYFGERGNPLNLIFITMGYYTFFYKKMRMGPLVLMGVISVLVLFSIRETRNKSTSLAGGGLSSFTEASKEAMEGLNPILLFSDLIGACQELNFGYELTIRNGYSYPSQVILIPFLPFPKLPTLVSKAIYDKEPGELFGASVLDKEMSRYAPSAFGTHVVIDVFMRWGIIGVIIAFSLLGWLVSRYNGRKYFSPTGAVYFLLLLGGALYLARGSTLDLIRPLAYTYFFVWLAKSKINNKKNSIVISGNSNDKIISNV